MCNGLRGSHIFLLDTVIYLCILGYFSFHNKLLLKSHSSEILEIVGPNGQKKKKKRKTAPYKILKNFNRP